MYVCVLHIVVLSWSSMTLKGLTKYIVATYMLCGSNPVMMYCTDFFLSFEIISRDGKTTSFVSLSLLAWPIIKLLQTWVENLICNLKNNMKMEKLLIMSTCQVDQRNTNHIVGLIKCHSIIGDSDSIIYTMC